MADLAQHPSPTRAMLERAAIAFFVELAAEIDQPRELHPVYFDEDVALNVESSRARISQLDEQLIANEFDEQVASAADRLMNTVDGTLSTLANPERLFAQQLAARAEREKLELLVHLLTRPAKHFATQDQLFAQRSALAALPEPTIHVAIVTGPKLNETVTDYLRRRREDGVTASTLTEVGRALGWLQEQLGSSRPMNDIKKDEMRIFRDDISRLDVRMRGRSLAFADRLTVSQSDRISSHTAIRYWRSVLAFFDWSTQEGICSTNPVAGLKLVARKGETARTPEAYSLIELQTMFRSPLFAGFKSVKRMLEPGNSHRRLDQFWSGILPLYTGLRASELAQLTSSDFNFEADPPYLKIRTTDDEGRVIKTTKNRSSIRDVPLAPTLLSLGLREFVHSRAGSPKSDRIFREISVGVNRVSAGLTKFWTKYLKAIELWKPGRSTHVWRHTVIACLRANGAAEEDIMAFVGHSRGTVTSGYGGAYPIQRKMKTALNIDYGFDVVLALGGPYDPKVHR